MPDTMIENGDFLLVAKHGTLQVKGANVDFVKDLSGFIVEINKNNKKNKNIEELKEFFNYAEKHESTIHFRVFIHEMDVSAQVVVLGYGIDYDNGENENELIVVRLKTVKYEKV